MPPLCRISKRISKAVALLACLLIGSLSFLPPLSVPAVAQAAPSAGCTSVNGGSINLSTSVEGGPAGPTTTGGLVFNEGDVLVFTLSAQISMATATLGGTPVFTDVSVGTTPTTRTFTITAALAGRPLDFTLSFIGIGLSLASTITATCTPVTVPDPDPEPEPDPQPDPDPEPETPTEPTPTGATRDDQRAFVESASRTHMRGIVGFVSVNDLPDVDVPEIRDRPFVDIKDRGALGVTDGKKGLKETRQRIAKLEHDYGRVKAGSLSEADFKSTYGRWLTRGPDRLSPGAVAQMDAATLFDTMMARENDRLLRLTASIVSNRDKYVMYGPQEDSSVERHADTTANIAMRGNDDRLEARYFSQTVDGVIPFRLFASGGALFLTGDSDGEFGIGQAGVAFGIGTGSTVGFFAVGSSGSVERTTSGITSDTDIQSIGGGGYAKIPVLRGQLNVTGTYLATDNEASFRGPDILSSSGTYDGSVLYVAGSYEQSFKFESDVVLTPSFGSTYLNSKTDGYTDSLGTAVASTEAEEFSLDVGFRVERAFTVLHGPLLEVRPYASAGGRFLVHDDGDVSIAGAEIFNSETAVWAVSAGVSALFNNGAGFGVDFHFNDVGDDSASTRVQGRLSVPLGGY